MMLVVLGGFSTPPPLPNVTYAAIEARPEWSAGSAALRASTQMPPAAAGTGGPTAPLAADPGATPSDDAPLTEGTPSPDGTAASGEPSDGAGNEGENGSGSQAIEEEETEDDEDEGPPPVFYEYEVQPGDTVSGIAAEFGIGTDYILWNNVNTVDDANSLQVGAKLQIPGVEGIIHSASIGETVSDLAVEYDSTTEAIVDYEANGFEGDPNHLPIGALILIPGGRRIPPVAPEVTSDQPGIQPEDPSAPSWTPPPLQVPAAPSWTWPATGPLTNYFSAKHPLGIDISMVVSTPIAAAMSGTVTFTGGNPCCSYGYHIIVQHADGYETLYGHLSEFWVAPGQWVNAGDLIGASGNTGYSTGPHLHFEVRKNGVYQDPLGYLP